MQKDDHVNYQVNNSNDFILPIISFILLVQKNLIIKF